MNRISWNEYFMNIAQLVSSRSTCLRRQTGAIIVKNKRILTTGYNGVPTGIEHCKVCMRENIPSGERHEMCRGLHAEQNCIIQAALYGIEIENTVLYTTHFPCSICAKMIINAGIKKIYYLKKYNDNLAKNLLKEAKVKVKKI